MCGIAGIIAWDNRFRTTREQLARMSGAIAHRGPDAEGMWLNHEEEVTEGRSQVGLVHRRLSIIDLDSRANQPFTDRLGRWIVFNGEIYNYRELRGELEKLRPEYRWKTSSDTEVLLAAYGAWGEKCVEHLNGMFAFGVWDEREQSLFLARDRMGQKPLYVAYLEGADELARPLLHHFPVGPVRVVAFASELSALRQLGWLDSATDPIGLGMYLSLGYIPQYTIYRGAVKLPPASCARFGAQGAGTFPPYFASYAQSEGASTSDGEASATTHCLVTQAVRRQLVADVPIGCFLSGGIDSSVVAAAMRASVPPDQGVLTFSIGFDDPRYDETAYAAAVARHLGTEHRQFIVRPDAAEDLPKLAAVYGEPFGDSSALPTHYLSRETRQHVKVALSGDGGDELFGGYERYRAMLITERIRVLPPIVRRSLTAMAALLPGVHPKSRFTRLKRLLKSVELPADARYGSYVRLFDQAMRDALLLPDLRNTVQGDGLDTMYGLLLRSHDAVCNALALDRITYLPEDLLTKLDRASMLHALEVRSPFMDHELVSFAAGLTTDQLLRGGAKRMLREAFAADLPDFVFKRKKMGFAVPIGEWFRDSLRGMLHDHLFAADSFAAGHFNKEVVQRLVEEHEQFRVDHSQRLYALLMLELWWRGQRAGSVMSA